MMPMMNMPMMSSMGSMMGPMGMMPQMMGMMPQMMGMMPQMVGMMPQMMGMMPQMMGMMPQMPMMARMTCEMDKEGMVCRVMPMEGMGMDMLRERCDAMTKMMSAGMPMMLMCGAMPMMMCVSTGTDMRTGAGGMGTMGGGSNVASMNK